MLFLKWWNVKRRYGMDFDHEGHGTHTNTHTHTHCHWAICSFVHSFIGFGWQVFRFGLFLSLSFRFEWWFLFVSLLLVPIGVVPFIFIPIRFIMPHKCVSQLCFHRLFRKSTHFWIYLRFTISSLSPSSSVFHSLSQFYSFTHSIFVLHLKSTFLRMLVMRCVFYSLS